MQRGRVRTLQCWSARRDVGSSVEEPQYQDLDRGHAERLGGAQAPANCIAFIVFAMPRMLITRFRLYASTCRLISVRTSSNLRVKKWVQPIQCLSVP